MQCMKCKAMVPQGADCCPECGEAIDAGAVERVRIYCKQCNGLMNPDPINARLNCPYCGATELLTDSEDVAIEKIRTKAYKDVEYAKLKQQREEARAREHKERVAAYRKSPWCFVTIGCIFLFALMATVEGMSRRPIGFTLALTQMILCILSWLMGMRIIRVKRNYLYFVPLILSGILAMLSPLTIRERNLVKEENRQEIRKTILWPESGLAKLLPTPLDHDGRIMSNTSTSFEAQLWEVEEEFFERYKAAARETCGFAKEESETDETYKALNADNYQLTLSYEHGEKRLAISLEPPEQFYLFYWPEGGLAEWTIPLRDCVGSVVENREELLCIRVGERDINAYNKYVDLCYELGYQKNYNRSDTSFYGENEEGLALSIRYEGADVMTVCVQRLKTSQSAEESVSEEETESGEAPQETVREDDGTISSEILTFCEEFEAFADEYCEFMKKYEESDNVGSMMIDYMSLMARYATFMNRMNQFDTSKMTKTECVYFLEVTARCTAKMWSAT